MRKSAMLAGGVLLGMAAAVCAQSAAQQDKLVRLNQIQVIGTHNSYNLGFAPSEAEYLKKHNPDAYRALEYKHASLAAQLDGGVRQLEIDVNTDPKGGKYAHPKIVELSQAEGLPADPDFDPEHKMDRPGMKVIHIPDVNQRSSCPLFTDCMEQIRAWSKAHPGHLPLFIQIETKHDKKAHVPGGQLGMMFTTQDFDALDAEILSVFPKSEIVTPDSVRGSYKTLEAAVRAGMWPTLAQARGKVMFVIDSENDTAAYVAGHPSLRGRVMFTNGKMGDPDAAFMKMNGNPQAEIDRMVKLGYIVRARADDSTVAARNNDTTRRDELLRSGATMISTDYPLSEPSEWSGYSVGFPGGLPGRCNVVNAPKVCKDNLLEPGTGSGGEMSTSHHP